MARVQRRPTWSGYPAPCSCGRLGPGCTGTGRCSSCVRNSKSAGTTSALPATVKAGLSRYHVSTLWCWTLKHKCCRWECTHSGNRGLTVVDIE